MASHCRVERRWSDLPGDLLSDVYLRYASAYDRARFAAVCSTWRAAAAWHPRLLALPLLLPSTGHGERDREARAYSLEDGRALRVPLPWFPWGNWLVGSYDGGWIATISSSSRLLIVNLFSGTRAARLDISRMNIRKVAFSEDPLSGGCILTATASLRTVGVRKVGCVEGGWRTWCGPGMYGDLVDVTFCNGKLYGLTERAVIKFDIGANQENVLVAISVYSIDPAMRSLYTVEVSPVPKYVFELHGKLAIAVEIGPRDYYSKKGHFFQVFQLTDVCNDTTTSWKYTWTSVTSLGDHALFLGPAQCKAVHVSPAGQRGGVAGNRIYYSKQHSYLHDDNMECLARLDMGSCTVHCRWENEDKDRFERIMSRGYHYRKDQEGADGCNTCIWLWPADF